MKFLVPLCRRVSCENPDAVVENLTINNAETKEEAVIVALNLAKEKGLHVNHDMVKELKDG